MNILIFGSNGFIGKHLAHHFQSIGHRVLAPKRQEVDLLNQTVTSAYIESIQPDVVINAAISIHSVETNLGIHFNIDRCRDHYGRLINIGSGAEYSSQHYTPLMPETQFGKFTPSDTYGISKFTIARDIERSTSNAINLRVFGIYGEHEDHSRRFISNNICSAIRNGQIIVNKNALFDYIDVLDFCKISEKFLTLQTRYRSYNVCSAQPRELIDIASVIHRISRKNCIITVHESRPQSHYSGDNSRLLSEIGSFAFTPMDKSVSRLYDWYETEFTAGRIT